MDAPSLEALKNLYEIERKTTREIGKMYDASKTSVIRWLKRYGIPLRSAHNGLLNRGIVPPTREELIELVHVNHHSYPEIAAMYGVDSTAVPYWLKKFNIERPKVWDTRYKNNKPIMPTEDVLRDLYENQCVSLADIGEIYGVKSYAIRSVCRKYNIAIKPDGWTGQRYICKDGHQVRSVYEQRVDDWLYMHNIEHIYEPQLPFDHRYHGDFLAGGYYIEIWGVRKNKAYTERRKYKTQLYQAHKLPLIQIDENRMTRNTWQKHLEKFLTKQII